MKTKKELIQDLQKIEIVKENLTLKKINTLIDNQVKYYNLTVNKNHRKIINIIKSKAEILKGFRSQKAVKSIDVVISWSRGNMGAMQSKAEATIKYKDNTFNYVATSKTGGYGYDKESTTLAELLNDHLRYLIIDKRENVKAPYGVHIKNDSFNNYFEGGVGVSCYYSIIEYLGGKMTNTINTTSSNIYNITF